MMKTKHFLPARILLNDDVKFISFIRHFKYLDFIIHKNLKEGAEINKNVKYGAQ